MYWALLGGMALAMLLLYGIVRAYGSSREREGRAEVAGEQSKEALEANQRADEARAKGLPSTATVLARLRARRKRRHRARPLPPEDGSAR